MEIVEIDNSAEKKILMGMIVSDRFLNQIRTIYNHELMEIPYAKTVAGWCLQYYKQYEKAPRQHIQDIFNSSVRNGLNPDQADLIGDFLSGLSKEYERQDKLNVEYLMDVAEGRFNNKQMEHLCEDVQALLSNGEILEAESLIGTFKAAKRPSSGAINPYTNKEVIRKSFEEDECDRLFSFPGALGDFINDYLVRDSFLGLMGKIKVGKTWLLQECAYRAAMARCNVAFFQTGDLSEKQMVRRKHIRLAGKSNLKRYCGDIVVPVMDCLKNQKDTCTLKNRKCNCGFINKDKETPDLEQIINYYKKEKFPEDYFPCTYCQRRDPQEFRGSVFYEIQHVENPLTWQEGYKLGRRFGRRLKGRDFKLATYPNSTINVKGIEAQLDIWENTEGFIPDVILIDYADILAPENPRMEFRHQENDRWKALRRLSQERHCLVIAPTQTDAKSFDAITVTMKNFSEDMRKLAHVTGMLGMNQTDKEKEAGILRLGWVALREGEFYTNRTVNILQCLKIGRPVLGSFY